MRYLLFGCIILSFVPLSESVAQQPSLLEVGERARIHTIDSERMVGRIEAVRSNFLLLIPDDGSSQLEVPFQSISRLEVRRNTTRGRGAWKWAKRGFVAGAVMGAATCSVDVDRCRESPDMKDYEVVLGSALFFGGGVAFLGAVGGAVFPGKRWERISISEYASITPHGTSGVGLTAIWRF